MKSDLHKSPGLKFRPCVGSFSEKNPIRKEVQEGISRSIIFFSAGNFTEISFSVFSAINKSFFDFFDALERC